MVDPSAATVAAVTPIRAWALLICASSFADRTWLQTYYPRGETIDTSTLVARTTSVSVADALARHQRRLEAMGATHGEPRRLTSVAGMLRLDVEFRELHAQRTMRRNVRLIIGWALLLVAFSATFLVLLLLGTGS